MLISFTTATKNTDGSAITPAAVMKYILFIDTVNPPVKSYPVPDALVTSGITQPDGSKLVHVDAVKDLGLAPTPGTTYFVAAEDSENGTLSAETGIASVVYTPIPMAPGNFTVA